MADPIEEIHKKTEIAVAACKATEAKGLQDAPLLGFWGKVLPVLADIRSAKRDVIQIRSTNCQLDAEHEAVVAENKVLENELAAKTTTTGSSDSKTNRP